MALLTTRSRESAGIPTSSIADVSFRSEAPGR